MPEAPKKAKKTKKGRKVGRSAARCLAYKNSHMREQNKLRRALRRLKDHPNDKCLLAAIERFKIILGKR